MLAVGLARRGKVSAQPGAGVTPNVHNLPSCCHASGAECGVERGESGNLLAGHVA